MKPIYIEMKAFGSYRDEKISFEHADHGLFLITGDTGAGKTTIFDAISYALFDKTSGGKRSGTMMRSQYAPDGIKTEVRFKFSYDGKVYTIKRWPKQPKFKKLKDEERYERLKGDMGAGVELTLPDDTPFLGSKDETDEKIRNIIGLDAAQFTQIAMLAQGDFMKLLLASSNERKDIFAKIFDTKIYEQIQYELERMYKQSYGRLEENKKDILRELERVRCIENSEYEAGWEDRTENGLFTEVEQEALLELIKNIGKEAKNRQKTVKKSKEHCDTQIEEINTKIQQAETVNHQFTQLSKYCKDYDELCARADEMEQLKQKAKDGEKALLVQKDFKELQAKKTALNNSEEKIAALEQWIKENEVTMQQLEEQQNEFKEKKDSQVPTLISEIGKISDSLEQYDELNGAIEKCNQSADSIKQLEEKIDSLYNEKNTLEDEYKRLQEATEILKSNLENIDTLNAESEMLERRKNSLDIIFDNEEKLKRVNMELSKIENVYETSKMQAETCQAEYDRIYKEFINSQAEILRAELKNGAPCPVCGSVHYNLDEVTFEHMENTVDNVAMENAKSALDVAKKSQEEVLHKKQSKSGERENILFILNKECGNICGCEYEKAGNKISEEYDNVVGKLENLQQRKDKAKENLSIIETNEMKIGNLRVKLEENEAARTQCNEDLNTLKLDKKEHETSVKTLQKQLPYANKEIALKELKSRKDMHENLENQFSEIQEKYQFALKEMNTKNGEYTTEQENRNARKDELITAKTDYEESLKKNGFDDTDSFKRALLEEREITQLNQKIAEYDRELAVSKDNVKRLRAETAGKEPVKTDALYMEKEKLKEEKNNLESQNEQLYNIVAVNEESYKKVRKLYKDRDEMNAKNRIITSLHKTANGQYSGKKINFQTYIQRRYFKQVIERANKRLYKMSNNQFILQCRDLEDLGKSGYVGLDLDVYSIVNDQVRDVKTLSGGESFVAALSMALGMADIIQDSHGSVHIDTMFIDEGFGSLSDETRNQAIGILNELSEGKRLVGIISHVSELKAQVETKLVVSKTDSGSSTKWEY